jgi:hypothetical protein
MVQVAGAREAAEHRDTLAGCGFKISVTIVIGPKKESVLDVSHKCVRRH